MTAGTIRNTAPAHLRWAAMLVMLMLLLSPGIALAAPVAQEIDPALVGTWQSSVSENGETVTVSLFDDGSISGISTYEANDDQILYGGSWESTSEDTFMLYIESVDGETAPEPIEFSGLVTRRGLRLPDAPDWGRNGMSLELIDESPTDFSLEASAEATAEPDAEATAEPTEEPTEEATSESTEASAADEAGFAGVYVSDAISDDAGGVTTITIVLFEDGSMETTSTYEGPEGDDQSFETGSWVDNGDGSVTVTFETIDGQPYENPVPITFADNGSGQLAAPDLVAFGDNGLVVNLVSGSSDDGASETTSEATGFDVSGVPGLYASAPIEGGGSINGVMVYLDEEGFVQSIVMPFSGEDLPISRVGEWSDNGDGTISISLGAELLFDSEAGAATASDLDTPEVLDFTVAEGMLVNPELTLVRAGEVITLGSSDESSLDEGIGEEALAEEDASTATGDDPLASDSGDSVIFISPTAVVLSGTTASLVLLEDGTATLSVTGANLPETVMELGTWEADEETNTLTLTLALGGDGLPLDEPSTILFTFDEASESLIPGDYDTTRYGPDLTLEMVSQ